MSILSLLSIGNYLVVNKTLVKRLGLKPALMLSELCSEHMTFEGKGALKDGFFYSTQEYIEENISLSPYEQREAIKKLQEEGLVEIKKQGIPCRSFYRMCPENIERLFKNKMSKILTTGSQEISQQGVKNFESNSNQNINHASTSSAISSVDTTDITTEEEESSSKKLSKKSSSSGKTLREDFEEIWKLYPNKQGKKKAFAAYERAIRDGVENADILDGVKRYAKYCHDRRDEKRYIKHGDTWFNGACWQDEYDDTPSRPQSALEQGTHLNENLHKAYERERAEGRINEYGEAPF